MFRRQETVKVYSKRREASAVTLPSVVFETGDVVAQRAAFRTPAGYNPFEWQAITSFDFCNAISLVYWSVCEQCKSGCPTMSAGPRFEFYWIVDEKPRLLPARRYCDLLFAWIDETFNDQALFPEEFGDKPPKKFAKTIAKINRRLFRVYAHLFVCHRRDLTELGLFDETMKSFVRFYVFCLEFHYLRKEDLEPLRGVVDGINKQLGL